MSYIISNPADLARTKNKWGMGFYAGDIFPFPQGTAGPFQAFPGTAFLKNPPFPIPPVITCPQPKTGVGMGFFRPNQAIARHMYWLGQDSTDATTAATVGPTAVATGPIAVAPGGPVTVPIVPAGLNVDPTMLIGGIALLAAAMFLFGTKKGPAIKRRRIARYRRKIAALEGF